MRLRSDHWRKNIPVLAEHGRVFAIDLLGFGFADKPTPNKESPAELYNFENWGQQLVDFCAEVVGSPAFLLTNSVGGACHMWHSTPAPRHGALPSAGARAASAVPVLLLPLCA